MHTTLALFLRALLTLCLLCACGGGGSADTFVPDAAILTAHPWLASNRWSFDGPGPYGFHTIQQRGAASPPTFDFAADYQDPRGWTLGMSGTIQSMGNRLRVTGSQPGTSFVADLRLRRDDEFGREFYGTYSWDRSQNPASDLPATGTLILNGPPRQLLRVVEIVEFWR